MSKHTIPNDPVALRTLAGLTVRQMSDLAGLADPTGWARVERTGKIDAARLTLARARVAMKLGRAASVVCDIVTGAA